MIQKLLNDGDPHWRQVFGETTYRVLADSFRLNPIVCAMMLACRAQLECKRSAKNAEG